MFATAVRRAPRPLRWASAQPGAFVRRPASRRPFSRQAMEDLDAHFRYADHRAPRVRVLGPIVWAVSVSGLIYLGCAGYSVHHDVTDYKKRHRTTRTPTLAQVDNDSGWYWAPKKADSQMLPVPLWGNLSPIGKSVYSLVAINAGLYGASRLTPTIPARLAHVPVLLKSYTLFTSTFVHGGALHWAFNAYATVMFGLQVGEGKVFAGSGSHFLSFYLSAGTLSGLGSHLWSALPWPQPITRFTPTLGASGAIMSIVGSWLMTNPTSQIGIIFVPMSWQAQDFLWGLLAFETLGAFGALKFLRLGINHASHLCGLGIGALYTTYDGKQHVWEPARNISFDIMRRVGLV
ncbi:uncharacterized protein B0I36DRAFT_309053 [Microdochium trichocladiopsis]|uniref:Peptidase S54 rhomboid domain-containing protein n=1 Tax=Microdochium trichocladiopsis TaxID=1682393 RepID=A0A9P8YGT2_9PEZI|nr:uncharacterized protein B0I36DRAFT_309053 [Microdochium trichocladiopsis]KAH7039663.1 hypothetical protein B0I36DRAFT_309053 [Microdochium trichocladiopsis]